MCRVIAMSVSHNKFSSVVESLRNKWKGVYIAIRRQMSAMLGESQQKIVFSYLIQQRLRKMVDNIYHHHTTKIIKPHQSIRLKSSKMGLVYNRANSSD